jgi:PBSX family phage terminase large subunit
MPLSPKQELTIRECTAPYNFWVGAVSSGKTFSSVLALRDKLRTGPKGDVMILGVSRPTIQRNVLNELYSLLGSTAPSTKTTETKLYGRNVYFVGAHDESAVRVIQGATLAFAYVDEATCIPYPVFKMLESRLRVPGAQLLATCNPEGPAHWLKKEFIDRAKELGYKYWNFRLDDNPTLDEAYKSRIKSSYSGMWYNRYILGEWAAAHGLIYDQFDHLNIYENATHNPSYFVIGIDYGTTNATAAVLGAISPTHWPQIRIDEEYYYDSSKEGRSKTDAEYADDIKKFCGYRNVKAIYVDPAAASFKIALQRLDLPVVDANNDVLLGIRHTSKFISQKNLVIHKSCTTLIEHLQSYSWDPKAADRGEDKPLKKQDHICDALRYMCASAFPRGEFYCPDEHLSIDEIRRQVFGDNRDLLRDQYGGI